MNKPIVPDYLALAIAIEILLEKVVVSFVVSYSPHLAMMVNCPILINPVRVYGCVQNDLKVIQNHIFGILGSSFHLKEWNG